MTWSKFVTADQLIGLLGFWKSRCFGEAHCLLLQGDWIWFTSAAMWTSQSPWRWRQLTLLQKVRILNKCMAQKPNTGPTTYNLNDFFFHVSTWSVNVLMMCGKKSSLPYLSRRFSMLQKAALTTFRVHLMIELCLYMPLWKNVKGRMWKHFVLILGHLCLRCWSTLYSW